MGNCQAAEAEAVVIQHPGGKVERLYGAATAADVMRGNPGHYVALVVLGVGGAKQQQQVAGKYGAAAARVTKVKLLKPKDALLLGQVYRLITSQEVAKAIQARRQDKQRRCEESPDDRQLQQQRRRPTTAVSSQEQGLPADRSSVPERKRAEKDRHRSASSRGGRHWQPSLNSISEFPS